MKTQQEIFDFVTAHLRKQGVRSIRAGICAYRSPNGHSCAIGCLIPDSMYSKAMDAGQNSAEGVSFEKLIKKAKHGDYQLPEELTAPENYKLLQSLQFVHDNAANWNGAGFNQYGEATLAECAVQYKLIYTAPGAK